MLALARHFPCAAVRMIERYFEGLELQTKEARRAVKGRVNHPIQLEVRFQRGLV